MAQSYNHYVNLTGMNECLNNLFRVQTESRSYNLQNREEKKRKARSAHSYHKFRTWCLTIRLPINTVSPPHPALTLRRRKCHQSTVVNSKINIYQTYVCFMSLYVIMSCHHHINNKYVCLRWHSYMFKYHNFPRQRICVFYGGNRVVYTVQISCRCSVNRMALVYTVPVIQSWNCGLCWVKTKTVRIRISKHKFGNFFLVHCLR